MGFVARHGDGFFSVRLAADDSRLTEQVLPARMNASQSRRLTVPPLDGLDLPHLRAAMWALDGELMANGAGGPLAADSLANVLAVHLLRHVLAPRRPERGRDGTLPRGRSAPSSRTSRTTSTPA